MIYFIIICTLGFILLFIKLSISIEYLRTEENDRAILTFSIAKNLIKVDIPFIDIDTKEGFWGIKLVEKLKKNKDFSLKQKSFISFSNIKDLLEKSYIQFNHYKNIFIAVRNYLKTKVVCRDLIFHLDFGLGDASTTGIASGLVWGMSYNILSIADSNMILKHTDVKIVPNFNESKLHIKFYCIFTIRIVHIIIVFFIILFSVIHTFFKKRFSLNRHSSKTVSNF
ncbi:MAG: hypothetical protein PWP27_433 [Clostridiales bacterium]|jgi:hypothetical protein|nr:hypothetical protein [Clostridiales bacterium]MDK2932623.1 hypothetical protein [Clostridiales bacterium]